MVTAEIEISEGTEGLGGGSDLGSLDPQALGGLQRQVILLPSPFTHSGAKA